MTSVQFIFAEAGDSRGNAGDASLPAARLEPSLSSFRKHFPEATFTVYTDQEKLEAEGCEIVQVADPPFDKRHARYGWRFNDLYEAVGLLESKADVAIAVDSDLFVVSNRVRSLIPLALRFGLAMGVNGRHLMHLDAKSDCDGGKITDESGGNGMCHCTALWAFATKGHDDKRRLLDAYCGQIIRDAATNIGARGPLSLWRAEWETGIAPYTLPSHYCVTGSNLWVPAQNAIVLHVGHQTVANTYAALIEAERNR